MIKPTGRLLFAYNTITELNKRITELEKDRDKYKDLFDLAIEMDYPKKEFPINNKTAIEKSESKNIIQQLEDHKPFIQDCAREGMTMAQIAKRLGVTPTRLANAFNYLGLSINRLRNEGAKQ